MISIEAFYSELNRVCLFTSRKMTLRTIFFALHHTADIRKTGQSSIETCKPLDIIYKNPYNASLSIKLKALRK